MQSGHVEENTNTAHFRTFPQIYVRFRTFLHISAYFNRFALRRCYAIAFPTPITALAVSRTAVKLDQTAEHAYCRHQPQPVRGWTIVIVFNVHYSLTGWTHSEQMPAHRAWGIA